MGKSVQIRINAQIQPPGRPRFLTGRRIFRNLMHTVRMDALVQIKIIVFQQCILCLGQTNGFIEQSVGFILRQTIKIIHPGPVIKKLPERLPVAAAISRPVRRQAGSHENHHGQQHTAIQIKRPPAFPIYPKKHRQPQKRTQKQSHFRPQEESCHKQQGGHQMKPVKPRLLRIRPAIEPHQSPAYKQPCRYCVLYKDKFIHRHSQSAKCQKQCRRRLLLPALYIGQNRGNGQPQCQKLTTAQKYSIPGD